jgi:SAM-dependent methyltransferase
MLDWRAITGDPNDREAIARMDVFLRSITRIEETSRREMLIDFCRGLDVLDIGAAGHVAQETLGGWEHGLIRDAARSAIAAELNQANCDHYNAKGFDFRCVDATSDIDLGERFDRVFIGDVIEHVNDPVALLAFAKRHLRPGGRVLITTPNPFAPRFRQHRRQRGMRYVMANLEHTRWISISNMHELAGRAGLELSALRWPLLKKPRSGAVRSVFMLARKCQLAVAPLEEVFAEYAFELALPAPVASA